MRIVVLVVLLLFGSPGASAQAYCSLLVTVVDPHGREVEADVTMQEENGRAVTLENQPGGVRFCDLGLQPVTITVGSPECNQVSVRQVPLDWGKTATVKIIYDSQPCLIEAPPVAACRILFRFTDEGGKWIPGVALDPPVSGFASRSDTFGRMLLSIASRTELRATARREGFLPYPIHLTCSQDLMHSERLIRLRSEK